MDNKQLEHIIWDALFIDIYKRFCNGQNVKKSELWATFEAQKERQKENIDKGQNLSDEHKYKIKQKLSKMADAGREYFEEVMRCQNRLIE